MVNYNESKIYKIISNCGNLIYVGSTSKKYLSTRLAQHKQQYKFYKKATKNNTTSFQLFDAYEPENCEIILIENVNCNSKNELHARERFYIESLDCVNKCIPSRTKKEYRTDNKEKINEQSKVYYEDTKEQKKVYYENNKERQKEYEKLNQEKIHQQKNEKNVCLCGGKFTHTNKLRHFSSQKHINFTIKQYQTPLDPIPDLQESAII